jgi:hypothetical protein
VVKSWNAEHRRYTWPDGSQLWVMSSESDWSTIQGVEIDLVTMDEEPPRSMWIEMQRRRRGKVRTRYAIPATATEGLTWTYSDLYLPWLKYHKEKHGMSEQQAMKAQLHRFDDPNLADLPGIWCWPYGSHADNPTATKETWALYLQMTAASEPERLTRLYGGHRDFTASPVFDRDNLELMRPKLERGRTGTIERIDKEKRR